MRRVFQGSVKKSGAPSWGRLAALGWLTVPRQHVRVGGGRFVVQMDQYSLDESVGATLRHSLFNTAVRRLDDDLDLPGAALAKGDNDVRAQSSCREMEPPGYPPDSNKAGN
jgi:hypothetical protein